MTNQAKQPSQSYTALTQQVVREAEEPIPVAEITRRVHSLRPIESPSPERLIRHAVSQSRLIANTGDGRYWWYPRLLRGSRVRVPLITSDLESGRIVFDHDARDLLWPSFFAASEQVDRNPIELRLGAGDCVSLPFFKIGDAEYSDPAFDLYDAPGEFGDEFRTRLDRAVIGEGARFLYEYDFGDCWWHGIEVEKILPAAEGERYPKLVDGKRACPPEDCGGVTGYANFLEGIGDENHPEHEDLLAWAGGYFDPERFDVEGVNWILSKFAEICAG